MRIMRRNGGMGENKMTLWILVMSLQTGNHISVKYLDASRTHEECEENKKQSMALVKDYMKDDIVRLFSCEKFKAAPAESEFVK